MGDVHEGERSAPRTSPEFISSFHDTHHFWNAWNAWNEWNEWNEWNPRWQESGAELWWGRNVKSAATDIDFSAGNDPGGAKECSQGWSEAQPLV